MLRFPPRRRTEVTMPLTSLIDIVFQLLIYFLLTSSWVVQESINIRLPEVRSDMSAAEPETVVAVDSMGIFHFAGSPVDEATLASLLRGRLAQAAKKAVVVQADRGVLYDRVVRAMDVARAAGAETLSLAIERKPR